MVLLSGIVGNVWLYSWPSLQAVFRIPAAVLGATVIAIAVVVLRRDERRATAAALVNADREMWRATLPTTHESTDRTSPNEPPR